MPSPLRILLADDSATARLAMRRLLAGEKDITIVAEAADGETAVAEVMRQQPDIVLMDIVMPRMNGLEATRAIMSQSPVPVILISDLMGADADLNFKALEAGAIELIRKPSAEDLANAHYRGRFLKDLRIFSEVPLITRRGFQAPAHSGAATVALVHLNTVELVAIGASTGGPPAIAKLLACLPGPPPWPILITQHITSGFTQGMARWLTETMPIPVSVAQHREPLQPGKAYLAPDNHHMILNGSVLEWNAAAPYRGHRPSVNALFDSIVASGRAPGTVGILLTGMGDDGAAGLAGIRNAGGWTIAQDESSSAVYGMPKAAADTGGASEVLSIDDIGIRLRSWAQRVQAA